MRPQKITFGEMRADRSGTRGIRIYCSDYRCSHFIAMSADGWPDDVRLSNIEPRFVCKACGKRGADAAEFPAGSDGDNGELTKATTQDMSGSRTATDQQITLAETRRLTPREIDSFRHLVREQGARMRAILEAEKRKAPDET